MKRLFTILSLLFLMPQEGRSQINHALTATAAHSGGGATIYAASNYNDGVIAANSGCTSSATPWGWVSGGGWISFTWAAPVTFNRIVLFKSDRPMTACQMQYWNGSAFVTFLNYTSGTCSQDSVTFSPITTTILRLNAVTGSNPNHREIRVIATNPNPPTVTGATTICSGNTLTLTASSPATSPVFTWSGPAGFTATGATINIPLVTAANAGTYSCVVTSSGMPSNPTTTTIVVNPSPVAITGGAVTCEGATTTLNCATSGGTWLSGNAAVATVSGSGTSATLTGILAGTANISYRLTSTGCQSVRIQTINAVPSVTGSAAVCVTGTATLSATPSGGTWNSANSALAMIVPSSGVMTGVSAGIVNVSYTSPNGCFTPRRIVVNPLPVTTVTPASDVLCLGETASFSATSPDAEITLLSEGFNSGLGGWTITNGSGSTDSWWKLVTPPGDMGFGGDGTPYLQTAASAYLSGATVSTITSPSFSTVGGFASVSVSFNQYLLSFAPDVAASVEYSIDGGSTWGVATNQATSIITDFGDDGNWSAANPELTVTLPPTVLGQNDVRIRLVYNAQSLYWLVDNIRIKGISSPSTFSWSGAAGLSCAPCASPDITPTVTGTNAYNVITTTGAGCTVTTPVTITVNALPANITGNIIVCEGTTGTLTSSTGGAWTVSDPSVAGITAISGSISGIAAGTTNVTYTFSTTGCMASAVVTVLAAPAVITPASVALCNGNGITLSNTTPGGVWSGSNPSVATVNSLGEVSSVSPGIAGITYTMPNGCYSVRSVSVNALPAVISGSASVCEAASVSLSNTDPLGTWSSDNTAIATVNSLSGAVTGVAAGNTYITYTLPTGCRRVAGMQVNPIPPATTGASSVCAGGTTVVTNTAGGGTWSSSAPGIAAVDASGIITASSLAGVANISYTYTTTGCTRVHPFTVNSLPAAIGGTQKVCKDAQITMTNTDAFGTWSSTDATIASVDPATGVVSGIASGNTNITYTLPTGCIRTRSVTVNPLPNTIGGAGAVCEGATTILSNTTPMGTWSSADVAVATISSTGLVSPVTNSGTVTMSYTINSTGCYVTKVVTVNPLPSSILGPNTFCTGIATTMTNVDGGGIWASGNTAIFYINPFTGAGFASGQGTTNITYTLPTGCRTTKSILVNANPGDIYGATDVCVGRQSLLANTAPFGAWVSANTGIATVTSSGMVRGISAGTTEISYLLPTGCYNVTTVNVNPLPSPITGNFSICQGAVALYENADSGGVWSTNSAAVASFDYNGTLTANLAGNVNLTYTLPTGCIRTQSVFINPLPASITGISAVCEGQSTEYNSLTSGGTWSSATPSVADIDPATGVITTYNDGVTIISYTLSTGCYRTRTLQVNEMPTPIAGSLSSCPGASSLVTSTPTNGIWSSGATAAATISTGGMVSAYTPGTALITYTLPTGCRITAPFVVNPLPAAITGTRVLCNGATTTLANASTGGNWSTANPLVADIDATSGELTGNGAGVTTVTYTLPTGCARSANVTVNALPATITGNMAVCEGSTTQLATTSNGGTWSSDNTAVATVSNSGVVSGIAAGGANIAYTLPTGCRTTTAVVVNALPDNITGAISVCLGQQATVLNSTAGGTWTSSNTGIADVDGTGSVTGMGAGTAVLRYTVTATGCSRTKSFVVNPLPAAITGSMSVCQGSTTTLGNASAGGSWSSSNSSIAGISAGGNVSGLAVGFSIITYTLPTGCSVSNTMVVNALPEPITGTAVMCAGGSTTLESATTGGTWSINNSNASVTSAGVVNGLSSGTSVITYMTGNGCNRVRSVTVNALPGLITGAGSVCPGQTLALGNSVSGGTWSSDNTAVATVDVNGVVTPVTTAGGTAFIAYTLPTGCVRSRQITVHPAVEAITGTGTICRMGTTTLSNATAGGVWTSSNAAIAAVDAAGMVSGAGAGAATIIYTIPATGCKSEMTVVVNPLPGNISGASAVCVGSSVVLSNTVPGGSWSTGDTTITITGSGMVSGVHAGSAMLTYTLPTGCNVTRSIVVNALPVVKNVTGGGSYCAGGNGVAVGVDGSEAGTIYKLMNGGTTPVITMMGSGTGSVDFGMQTGAGSYMVTAVSAAGCMRNMNGSAVVSVTPLVTPEVSLSSDKGSSVCAGTAVTYSAAAVNGGTTPVYEWRVNGAIAGTGASYSYNPADGDVVVVKMTSNAACPSVSSVSSELTMTVRANLTPAVVVTANSGNNICAGTAVTYSAAGVNGGSAPVYTWVVNGAPVAGATNTVYSYTPANGDVVLCRLTSSYGCVTTNDVASNSTTMSVAPVFVPEVEVVANPGTVVPAGTEVTFTTVVNNAGASPTYQWMINAIPVNGATQPTFKTANLRNGDSVTCRVTGTGACSKTTINSVLMTITPATGVGQVSLSGSDLRLYPNPNTGVFEVRGTVGVQTDVEAQLEVTNVLGQVVYRGAARTRGGELGARIELGGNMANGMYLLNVTVGESRQSFHFVVKQ